MKLSNRLYSHWLIVSWVWQSDCEKASNEKKEPSRFRMLRAAMDTTSTYEEGSMRKRNRVFWAGGAVVIGAMLMAGCGSNSAPVSGPPSSALSGSVAVFGTDAPICDVESFVATITSASLVPQGGGQPVSMITATAPATVDFARLTDFTNILSTASVTPGT